MGERLIRPVTTLFMLISADGKISTGSTDARDFDIDLKVFEETSKGLQQYYDIEKTTDEWTMCTGKTQAKIGINNDMGYIETVPAKIVIVDNNHLTKTGINNLCNKYKRVVLVTENPIHPAITIPNLNLSVCYTDEIYMEEVLSMLKKIHCIDYLTVQTGSSTNGELVQSGLIDYVDFVIAPLIVGGINTPSVVGGISCETEEDMKKLAMLELLSVCTLKNGYIRMRYKVLNSR